MHEFFKNKKIGSYIDGTFVFGPTCYSQKCRVTNKHLFDLSLIQKKQVDQAIFSAHQAFLVYKKTSIAKRIDLLQKTKQLLLKHKSVFARLIVSEMGKTLSDALAEVDYTIGYFTYFSAQILQMFGHTINSSNTPKKIYTFYEPIGVCAVITPWNFPLAMIGRKIGAALACGCTVVIKPSPETPSSALFFAHILKEAGYAKGIVQVLIGKEKMIGQALLSSPLIKKLTFTGSTNIGKILYKGSADTLKKLSLELGGLAPFIVFSDADLEKASKEALLAKYRNSGQSCVAASFFLVEKKIYKEFSKLFYEKVKKLKIGAPFDLSTQFSPYLHKKSLEKAKIHTEDALKKGAKALFPKGKYFHPQILINCSKDIRIFSEETFSPVAAILPFDSEEEAIFLANNTPYGLACYLFSENLTKANRVIEKLDFGMIGLNDGMFSCPEIPFGGVKQSGFGREGGPEALTEFCTVKAISIKM